MHYPLVKPHFFSSALATEVFQKDAASIGRVRRLVTLLASMEQGPQIYFKAGLISRTCHLSFTPMI